MISLKYSLVAKMCMQICLCIIYNVEIHMHKACISFINIYACILNMILYLTFSLKLLSTKFIIKRCTVVLICSVLF